jgi:hypothetical protein
VGPSSGLNDSEKRKLLILPELELPTLGRLARSLRYSDYAIPALIHTPRMRKISLGFYRILVTSRERG